MQQFKIDLVVGETEIVGQSTSPLALIYRYGTRRRCDTAVERVVCYTGVHQIANHLVFIAKLVGLTWHKTVNTGLRPGSCSERNGYGRRTRSVNLALHTGPTLEANRLRISKTTTDRRTICSHTGIVVSAGDRFVDATQYRIATVGCTGIAVGAILLLYGTSPVSIAIDIVAGVNLIAGNELTVTGGITSVNGIIVSVIAQSRIPASAIPAKVNGARASIAAVPGGSRTDSRQAGICIGTFILIITCCAIRKWWTGHNALPGIRVAAF